MLGFRLAWFVHVNPDARFPRYTKTKDLTIQTGQLVGPLEDKHAAARLIHLAEDSFDLCRYYHILVEAPRGKACAYKEMGKCPAPCDGSISMDQYRRMIQWSADTVVDSAPLIRDQTERMKSAAADLRFESAGKIKAFIDSISKLGKGAVPACSSASGFQVPFAPARPPARNRQAIPHHARPNSAVALPFERVRSAVRAASPRSSPRRPA